MKWGITLGVAVLAGLSGAGCRAQAVEYTDAITRQVLVVNSTPVEYTDAITRQVLVYLPPYATGDARTALRVAAGLQAATQADVDRLNIVRDGASANVVDMRDTARILRKAVGLEP